jgi:hypothetical protein
MGIRCSSGARLAASAASFALVLAVAGPAAGEGPPTNPQCWGDRSTSLDVAFGDGKKADRKREIISAFQREAAGTLLTIAQLSERLDDPPSADTIARDMKDLVAENVLEEGGPEPESHAKTWTMRPMMAWSR